MSGSNFSTHTPRNMGANQYQIYAIITLCLLTLAGAWVSTVQAAETRSESTTPVQIKLAVMLQHSGITRLYEDLLATVLTETRVARHTCGDSSANVENIQRFITLTLDVDQMMDASVEQLSRSIDPSTIAEVATWNMSGAGRLIQEAEAQSAGWSEEEFAQRKLALASNPDWNDARKKLIMRVLDSAATVSFVTALHSETSALVLQAGDCVASDASRALINHSIQQARNDESFYSVFLRNNIHTTAAMIFSHISDANLVAYIEHSQSVAGRAWNDALLIMIRQVLRDRHAPMQHFLKAMTND